MTTVRLGRVAPSGHEHDLLQYFMMCGVWALTTYQACDLRCAYCVSYAQGPSEPRVTPGLVPEQLRIELARLPEEAVIAVGALIDGYPSAEHEHGATRQALEVLMAAERHIVIITKGDTILRDLNLLTGYPHVSVNVSLPSLDDRLLGRIEPHVASAGRRLDVVWSLHRAGVAVQLHVQPWIPGVTDAEAMIEAMAGAVPVCFGPLNIQSPAVPIGGLMEGWTQRDINEAYLAEQARIGPQPLVTWQQPVWLDQEGLTPEAQDPWLERPARDADVGRRNTATVRRLVEAWGSGASALVALGVVSPFVRGHDRTGLLSDRDHPESGQYADALRTIISALDEPTVRASSIVAQADPFLVDAEVEIEGHRTGALFDTAPSGRSERFQVSLTYRFDGNGLIVEHWQDVTVPISRSTGGVVSYS